MMAGISALTFADHTAYLNPPYPFLVKVPEYPQVKAIGLSELMRRTSAEALLAIDRCNPSAMFDGSSPLAMSDTASLSAKTVHMLDIVTGFAPAAA